MSVRRRLLWLLAAGQVAVLIGVTLYPINAFLIRIALIALLLTLWGTLTALAWPQREVRWAMAGTPVLALLILLLPGSAVDVVDLRERMVNALRRYEGVAYVWGGENALGIDCSGLVRRARIDAEWSYAFAHADPGAIRRALSLWWHDQSAKSLGRLEMGTTVHLADVADLASCPPERYEPGDFAIIHEMHVVAALGHGVWIEADPGAGTVLVLDPGSDNPWLTYEATLVRWQVLTR